MSLCLQQELRLPLLRTGIQQPDVLTPPSQSLKTRPAAAPRRGRSLPPFKEYPAAAAGAGSEGGDELQGEN